jgi:N-acetylglucosamine kinase-like BadF-type ATPase
MSFYLAVDVGGTKTDYLLADDHRELARIRTGSIKRLRVDAPTAAHNLDQALTQLTALTGVSMSSISRTCIGTAGESVPLVTDWLRESFRARVSGPLILLGDVEIALDAAFPGQPGIIVIAGTGSNVAGRSHTGSITTAGGWGPALADQGSGHRIGSEALRATFRAIDESGGRESALTATTLLPAILNFWRLPTLDHLIEHANSTPAPDVSSLTSLVLDCAQRGDLVAQHVLRREGEELAALVLLVIHRLLLLAPHTVPQAPWLPNLAFAGSILQNVAPVRDSLLNTVRHEFPAIHALPNEIDPIQGALWRARHT